MIEALLHGKLSCKQENMEDILTSNVFGMLQYFDTSRAIPVSRPRKQPLPVPNFLGQLGPAAHRIG